MSIWFAICSSFLNSVDGAYGGSICDAYISAFKSSYLVTFFGPI